MAAISAMSTTPTENLNGGKPGVSRELRTPLVGRACSTQIRPYRFLGAGVTGVCLITAELTGGAFSVFEISAEPRAVVLPHSHTVEDEVFYILEGSFEIRRGNEIIEMATGMALHGPRGVVHGLQCVGDKPGRALIITTPGGLEKFCEELNDAESLLSSSGEADPSRLCMLMSKYGMYQSTDSIPPKLYGHLAPHQFFGLKNHRGHVLISGYETNGALVLANLEVDPHEGLQPHLHRLEEEVFYVLEGSFELMLCDEIIEAAPGDFIFAPRGAAHSWTNRGDTPAYALVLLAPAENFQNFALEMEKLVAHTGEAGSPEGIDPDLAEEIAGIYRRHAIELVTSRGRSLEG